MAVHAPTMEPFLGAGSITTLFSSSLNVKGDSVDASDESRSMGLLDLPVDVLSVIIREVTHTNDLTALALTHSSLHRLVIPYIYSRFDIVWPEANPTMESRVGVDALTYGLATLVMAHDVFGEVPHQQECRHCRDCTCKPGRASKIKTGANVQIRRGNYFAQYTRKFSLGNGPADWVQEYLITKEGGKMLGTLVALALGRMRNLETFIWDMPTGVLRDVWLALASLGNRDDGIECRLEKVWVRWHDNRDAAPVSSPSLTTAGMQYTNLPTLLHGAASSLFQIPAYPSVEFPTFSILPPLKSITCLDIDEISYAEELSVLLERSIQQLAELRVGVAYHAQRNPPFRPIEDRTAVPPPFAADDEHVRPGGILGILFSRLCPSLDARSVPSTLDENFEVRTPLWATNDARIEQGGKSSSVRVQEMALDMDQLGGLLAEQALDDVTNGELTPTPKRPGILKRGERPSVPSTPEPPKGSIRKLIINVLELERVYISIPVISRAIDWTKLQSITLLGCMNHEALWKALRKIFIPLSVRQRTPSSRLGSMTGRSRASSASCSAVEPSEYKLAITRLHTDTVSKALLAFIKDALAPDTLEWLFLQETAAYKSTVTIDEIYRSAVRRHRGSLRKLLIDSDLRQSTNHTGRERERQPEDTNWRRWTANQDLLACVTGDKMKLRELSLCIDWRDWHFFVRRLPDAPTIRSLHISHIAEHTYGRSFEPREVALNILDFISLRSEMELCYLGIEKKCFEILEYKSQHVRRNSTQSQTGLIQNLSLSQLGISSHTHLSSASDSEDHDDGGAANYLINPNTAVEEGGIDNEESENWDMNSTATSEIEHTDDTDESDDHDDEVYKGKGRRKPAFRLREILFYDDKISIFKARHGKL